MKPEPVVAVARGRVSHYVRLRGCSPLSAGVFVRHYVGQPGHCRPAELGCLYVCWSGVFANIHGSGAARGSFPVSVTPPGSSNSIVLVKHIPAVDSDQNTGTAGILATLHNFLGTGIGDVCKKKKANIRKILKILNLRVRGM